MYCFIRKSFNKCAEKPLAKKLTALNIYKYIIIIIIVVIIIVHYYNINYTYTYIIVIK